MDGAHGPQGGVDFLEILKKRTRVWGPLAPTNVAKILSFLLKKSLKLDAFWSLKSDKFYRKINHLGD